MDYFTKHYFTTLTLNIHSIGILSQNNCILKLGVRLSSFETFQQATSKILP
jgi:hypothetical protein